MNVFKCNPRDLAPKAMLMGILLVFVSFTAFATSDPSWVDKVGARNFKVGKAVVYANDFGAREDGKTISTKAIQQAIDACAKKGGGKVQFRPGKYLTGSIFIKSGVFLHVDEGVELLGSQSLEDYPQINTRVAGIEMVWPAALVNINGQQKAGISGKGIINGQGKPFWDAYWKLRSEYDKKGLRWIVDYDAQRPRTVIVDGSEDIIIRDVTLKQAGFWTVHLLYSSYVTVDGIIIKNNINGIGPSTDGIDIDSSKWIRIQNADIDCNDDNFCIKSGRDWDGLRVNRPTEYVLITDCISRKGDGLITFGSETSGGMRHIIARNLKAHGTKVGIRLKSARNRGGVVEDILLENIQMDSVRTAFEVTPNWNPSYSYSKLPAGYDINKVPEHWKKMVTPVEPASKGIPTFQNIQIKNVFVKFAQRAINVDGLQENPLQKFSLENVAITAKTAGVIRHAKNWQLNNVKVTAQDGTKVVLEDTENINL